MSLSDRLREALKASPKWQRRPEILLAGNIPKPMHGLAPRVVLGSKWWNETRQRAYASTSYRCIACGIWKGIAPGRKWLEAHEVYEIDYLLGRMYYVETVPLCFYCHGYIHNGRLQAMLEKGEISHGQYAEIIFHGDRVLRQAGLHKPLPYDGVCTDWGKWRLVIDGREFKPIYKSLKAWEKKFGHA